MAEGSVVVYSTTNEGEGLPLWKLFEQATGLKVEYIRGSDTQILGRIIVENRAGQRTWDIAQTANVQKFPAELLAEIDPPEAKNLFLEARDPNRRWYGVYSNYNTPAYNTKFVNREELPRTYEELAKRTEWAGKTVIDVGDEAWLATIFAHYGEERGRKLIEELVANLRPVVLSGHLAVARAVAAGEYWIAINNYLNLTLNAKLAGGATDYFALDPVALFYGQAGVSAKAPHPNAARLAANFIISREAQEFLAKFGRLATRPDVAVNPPGVVEEVRKRTVITTLLTPEEDRKWTKLFNELFRKK